MCLELGPGLPESHPPIGQNHPEAILAFARRSHPAQANVRLLLA